MYYFRSICDSVFNLMKISHPGLGLYKNMLGLMCSIKPIIVLLWYFNNAFQTQLQNQKLKKRKSLSTFPKVNYTLKSPLRHLLTSDQKKKKKKDIRILYGFWEMLHLGYSYLVSAVTTSNHVFCFFSISFTKGQKLCDVALNHSN